MARLWSVLLASALVTQAGISPAETLNGFSPDNLSVSRDLEARGGRRAAASQRPANAAYVAMTPTVNPSHLRPFVLLRVV